MADLMDTFIENRSRVLPHHANNHGTVHGGNVMRWMDEVGALSAMRHAGETCVTATVANLEFERPVPVGDTVLIRSYVYAVGGTSLRVRLRAFREHPRTGEQEQTTESYFVFVAVDDEGQPVEVPEIDVDSGRERELRDAALDGEPDDLSV